MEIWPGDPYPLGASFDGTGTNFSIFSEVAWRVELCLFGEDGAETRLDMPEQTALCWHGYVPNVRPGQRYGFRVHGLYDPRRGIRCNPAKLLLDPYARAIEGNVRWNRAIFPYSLGDPDLDLAADPADSGPFVPKSVVVNPWFLWDDDRRLRIPWHETIIYEVHVKGFTRCHPTIPPDLRGTYAALATPAAIEYFKSLGVTAIELLPVHQFVRDYSGTGNSLNMRHPHVLQLIMDSLRYWVLDMHVDGFRFDLAATLARELHDVDRLSAFFDLIHQDPLISAVKLIAEPWDVGEGGYQVGNFPTLWSEWNG